MRHVLNSSLRTSGLLSLWMALLFSSCALASNGPNASLSASDVVKAQLSAFQNNDAPTPDAGIAIAFTYASPGNRQFTGPLSNFTAMLRQGYPELLNHRSHRLVKERLEAHQATIAVIIESRSREVFNYVFHLSLQYGEECRGCWMTDSVVRESAGSAI